MTITELLESRGYELKKKSANEYSSPCPFCGGKDRFCVWPEKNQYWCRQCDRKGDIIQLVRDMDGVDFVEAAHAVGEDHKIKELPRVEKRKIVPIPRKPIERKVTAGPKEKRIVKEYDYYGYDDQLVMQVVRFDPKDFRQRRPSTMSGKEWAWDLRGVQLVLYNLKEVMNSDYTFFCEGEKDVDTLRSRGLVATCNPMGAGKIKLQQEKHEILSPLKGKKVYIIPDNDPPGKKHAEEIAELLIDFATDIKIIDLPVGMSSDVTDFINDLGPDEAIKSIRKLISTTPSFKKESPFISCQELSTMEFQNVSNLIGSGILIDRGQLIIAGEGGVGKSLIRLEMAIHLAMGMDWLGFSIPSSKRVLICQYENGIRTEQARYHLMLKGKGITKVPDGRINWMKQTRENRPDFTKLKDVEHMIEMIGLSKPDVVIWDCLSNIHSTNENDNVKMRNVLDNITDIATELNHAVILVHHFNKPAENEQQSRHRFRGASSIIDWATCAFGVSKVNKAASGVLRLTNVKMRDAAELRPIVVKRDEYFNLDIEDDPDKVPLGLVIDTIIDAEEPLTKSQLEDVLMASAECARITARRAIDNAKDNRKIYYQNSPTDKRQKIVRVSQSIIKK